MRFLLATLMLFAAPAALAQVGIGGLLGDPTGVTVTLGGTGGVAVDVGVDHDLFVQAHYILRERRLRGTRSDVRFLFGPGGFYQNNDPDAYLGISALFGLGFYLDPQFELFGQVTPGVRLTPNTDGRVGAAVGLRFYP